MIQDQSASVGTVIAAIAATTILAVTILLASLFSVGLWLSQLGG